MGYLQGVSARIEPGLLIMNLKAGSPVQIERLSTSKCVLLGWIICEDRIQNTQFNVALKPFTATSSSKCVKVPHSQVNAPP